MEGLKEAEKIAANIEIFINLDRSISRYKKAIENMDIKGQNRIATFLTHKVSSLESILIDIMEEEIKC